MNRFLWFFIQIVNIIKENLTKMVSASESNFSLLPDPVPDRKLTDEQCPKIINKPIQDDALWSGDLPNWRLLKDYLAREGPISKPQITRILLATLRVL